MDLDNARKTTKKWAIRGGITLVLVGVLGSALYTYASLHYAYSTGERVGFVQKLSKRGWMCKTNEGELAMVNMAGQQAEIFYFTVPSEDVAKQIDSMAGHRVVLDYEEHRGIPSTCFGDTQYYVTGVHETTK